MAFVTLGQALEMALKRLEIDCAATAGTDADAEKMAESLDNSPPSIREDAEPSPPKRPVSTDIRAIKCLRTASPERVAPPFAVRKHLVVVVDNGGVGTNGGGNRSSRLSAAADEGKRRAKLD
jgi:hypothetical protein